MEPSSTQIPLGALECTLHAPEWEGFSTQGEARGSCFLNLTMAFSDHSSCLCTIIPAYL